MRIFTEAYTIGVDKKTGSDATANGNKLAITNSGQNIWFPKEAKTQKYITFKKHEKGDTFVAAKDSTRTKGEVLGKDCPEGQEADPLYIKGEEITRQVDSLEFVGFTDTKEAVEVSLEEKFALAAKYGVKLSM